MLEAKIDLWSEKLSDADARVIPTDGSVVRGEAVMKSGYAKQAAVRYAGLAKELGTFIRLKGNHSHLFPEFRLITFPTKHDWFDDLSDPNLIYQSVDELVAITDDYGLTKIVIPTPITSPTDHPWLIIRPIFTERLDNRFLMVSPP